jgi:Secretion system C-terminal sorting domain
MKLSYIRSYLAAALCALPGVVLGQSTMEFQVGTTIEVTAGADICADNVVINGSYLGSGTKCGGILPVEMSTIAAVADQENVRLNWTTATEANNFGFTVERRMISSFTVRITRNQASPAIASWVVAGAVSGSGTSSSEHHYSFVDKDLAPGRYSYRIKQVDNNGSFHYYDAVEIEVGLAPKEFTLSQNYPNPFNPSTTIEFTIPEDGHVALMLYDATGRQLETLLDEEAQAGRYYHLTVDASRYASGTYFYRLESGGRALTKKMMLVK